MDVVVEQLEAVCRGCFLHLVCCCLDARARPRQQHHPCSCFSRLCKICGYDCQCGFAVLLIGMAVWCCQTRSLKDCFCNHTVKQSSRIKWDLVEQGRDGDGRQRLLVKDGLLFGVHHCSKTERKMMTPPQSHCTAVGYQLFVDDTTETWVLLCAGITQCTSRSHPW